MNGAPGWYPDPAGGPTRRYWDGARWHNAIPAAKRSTSGWLVALAVIGGLIIFAVVVGAIFGGGSGGYEMSEDATYVGDALQAGVWETAGARGDAKNTQRCMWMRLSSRQASLSNVIAAGGANVGETIRVRIEPTDVGFNTQGCKPWRRVAD
jgi:hypothetical protein